MPTPIRPTRLPGQCNACFVPGNGVTVTLCPLHAAAEEMRCFVVAIASLADRPGYITLGQRARALLAAIGDQS